MNTDNKQMFIMACAVELHQMIPVPLSDLVNHVKLYEQDYMVVYDEWLQNCETSNYKWGICGDTIVNDMFYDAIAKILTKGEFNSWPRYGWKVEIKKNFEECLIKNVKDMFEYEIKANSIV